MLRRLPLRNKLLLPRQTLIKKKLPQKRKQMLKKLLLKRKLLLPRLPPIKKRLLLKRRLLQRKKLLIRKRKLPKRKRHKMLRKLRKKISEIKQLRKLMIRLRVKQLQQPLLTEKLLLSMVKNRTQLRPREMQILLEMPNTKLLELRDLHKRRKSKNRRDWKLRKGLLLHQLQRKLNQQLQSILMIQRIPTVIAERSTTRNEQTD